MNAASVGGSGRPSVGDGDWPTVVRQRWACFRMTGSSTSCRSLHHAAAEGRDALSRAPPATAMYVQGTAESLVRHDVGSGSMRRRRSAVGSSPCRRMLAVLRRLLTSDAPAANKRSPSEAHGRFSVTSGPCVLRYLLHQITLIASTAAANCLCLMSTLWTHRFASFKGTSIVLAPPSLVHSYVARALSRKLRGRRG